MTVETKPNLPDVNQVKSWRELVETTHQACQGMASSNSATTTHREAEAVLLRQCQAETFPEEVDLPFKLKCQFLYTVD